MRRFLFPLCSFLFLVLMSIGCQKAEQEKVGAGEPVTVSLNIAGDFNVDVSQDPLSKAPTSSNDAYAINVYYDKDGDGLQDDIYAYGLFDNVADMTITLLSNHKYKFICTLVKDARTTLYYGQAFNNTYSGYAYPFHTTASNSTQITNSFIIGTSTYFSGLGSGKSHIITTTAPSTRNYTVYPKVNRFYGVTSGYEPVPNGTVSIYLKRAVFGAKFVVTGLQEGSLSIDAKNATHGSFYTSIWHANGESAETIYTFPNVSDVYSNDLPLVATVSLSYDSDRGSLWDIGGSKDIQFKRNVMTTVNIDLNPDLSGAIFSITEEEMGEENVIDMGINTDGLIDVVVKPGN